MKFSMVSGLNESNFSEKQITDKFTYLCELLKPLGYKGIELAILEPEKIPVKRIEEIADSYEMSIPALGTGSTYLRFGFSFGDVNSSIREKALLRIEKYMEFASVSNSKIIIGLIRGRRTYQNRPKKEKENIINSLNRCCILAEESGLELIIEPINRFEIDSCNTIKETLELIDEIGSDYLKLMVDSFHTHLEEDPESIWLYLESIVDKIAHLHLADDTRRAPGTGHFNFENFINIFEIHNFNGFASVEAIMKPSFEEVAKQTMEYIKSINIHF